MSTADDAWKSGNCFKNKYTWSSSIMVSTTTLNDLISSYGKPDFCKIDVEGYEFKVLEGMSQQIPFLSFEFAREFLETKTLPCLEYLHSMGYRSFAVAMYEEEHFVTDWIRHEEIYEYINAYPDPTCWDDIYAKA